MIVLIWEIREGIIILLSPVRLWINVCRQLQTMKKLAAIIPNALLPPFNLSVDA
jgi:hypothetical protein